MKRFSSFLSAAAIVLVLVVSSLPASAASSPTQSSAGLSIVPRKDYVINPGQEITDELSIGNLSSTSDLYISLRIIDFTYTNDTGTPKLFLADNAPQTAWSLKPFTTLPETVVIPKGQKRTVPIKIKIPAGQGAGSYYSAIQYASGASGGGNVNLSASGVSLVFVSVPGKVSENLVLKKFGAYQLDKTGNSGGFVFIATDSAPQQLGYSLKNEGNVAESPAGMIVVRDMFGKEVTTIDNINPNSSLALIGQTRLFTSCIKSNKEDVQLRGRTNEVIKCVDSKIWPGRYTAELSAFYGQNGNQTKEVHATATFWYLPLWFIIICLAALLAIAFAVWRLYSKLQHTADKRRRRR